MKYEAVLFDLDGTVVDTLQNITEMINHTMHHFGWEPFEPAAVKPHLGWGVDYLMRHLLPELSDTEREEILRYYRAYYADHSTDNVCPYDGVLPMMERLKRDGFRLAIISNKPNSAVQPFAEGAFRDVISFALGEVAGLPRKPAPDMLEYTAEKMRVSLDRCVYVGDSEVDVQTAANAGVDCISVTWGFRNREYLTKIGATRFADTPEDLIALLEKDTI